MESENALETDSAHSAVALSLELPEDERRVISPEAERRRDGGPQRRLPRFVGNDVQRTCLVGLVMMNRRRNSAAGDAQRQRRGLYRSRRAEAMTDHRLQRGNRDAAQ